MLTREGTEKQAWTVPSESLLRDGIVYAKCLLCMENHMAELPTCPVTCPNLDFILHDILEFKHGSP